MIRILHIAVIGAGTELGCDLSEICNLIVSVVLKLSGMGIVCEYASFCGNETDFLQREKKLSMEKKIRGTKTKQPKQQQQKKKKNNNRKY